MASKLDIHEWRRSRSANMLALLRRLVDTNTYTWNKANADAAVALFTAKLEAIGFTLERYRHDDVGDTVIARSPAYRAGKGHLALCGHMDTVFPEDLGFDRMEVLGDRVVGPGVIDMKGGLVAAFFALQRLHETDALHDIPVSFIVNADEEVGSPRSRARIKVEAETAAAALVFECSGLNGEMASGRKGKQSYTLTCTGRAGHAGNCSADKPSAVLEMAHKTIALEALNDPERGVSVNVGKISGGMGPNTIAEHAEAMVDTRYVTIEDGEKLAAAIAAICAKSRLKGVSVALDREMGRGPMEQTESNREVYAIVAKAAAELGQPVAEERRGGVSDANFFSIAGVPTLDGLGPMGDRDHSTEEYMLAHSLADRAALAVLAIERVWRTFGGDTATPRP